MALYLPSCHCNILVQEPLPLPEQKRIVARVEELMALTNQLKELLGASVGEVLGG